MKTFPNSWEQLHKDMEECEQTSGQNMLQHGMSVWDWYHMIGEILSLGSDVPKVKSLIEQLKLPDWFFEYEEELAWNRLSNSHIYNYTKYHDCGKPYCREVDEQGRVHYPNHAEVSFRVWNHLNNLEPLLKGRDEKYHNQVADLIRRDMEIHTIKASDVETFCQDRYEAVTLLLVGLAEVHSNAEMFGGFDSTSFKIKWKQIDRRGRAILKTLDFSWMD
jgi:hypothetical protein